MIARRLVLLALGLAAPVASGCGAKDPVLAKVGDEEITASEFREAYLAMKPQERPPLTGLEDKQKFLQDLVSKQIMEHLAYQKYPELKEQQQWRLTRFREKELSDAVRNRLIRREIRVTPAMKDFAYEAMKRERDLRAMLIVDPDAAEWVRRQLDEGVPFGTLARDHSAQWVSDQVQGELGWKKPGTFPYPVDVAVWEAEVGSLVGPMRTALGSYIVQVLGERPAEVTASREAMDPLLEQILMEPIYLERQKAVQDSLKAAADPYYPSEGKALLNLKYHWEPTGEEVDNPFAALDAERVVPSFTAAEETTVVVDFKNAPDWTAKEYAERLSWYPTGMWPRGESEGQLVEALDLVVRDYLFQKAAKDLGFDNAELEKKIEGMQRQMRVNYYYYNDILPQFAPDQGQIDAYFQANRDRYQAPTSYKLAFFGSRQKDVIADLVKDWQGGAAFADLRAKYEKRDPKLLAIGETEWLYSEQDAMRDQMVGGMQEGDVTDVVMRNDVAMAFRLIARRPPRLLSYGEIKSQVDEDAKTVITDQKLTALLDEEGKKLGVTIKEKALAKIEVQVPAPESKAPGVAAPSPTVGG